MEVTTVSVTLISLLALIFLAIIFTIIMYALVFGAPFATVAQSRIKVMIKLLKLKRGDKVVDLGSGDGRIVIAFAKLGIEAHGYEINPVLIAWSRYRIRKLGLEGKAIIHFKDFWQEDLSRFSAVTLYGITHMMGRLEKKLKKELSPGSKIASNYFKFPRLKIIKEEDKVVLYEI